MIPTVGHHFLEMLKIFLRKIKSPYWEIFTPPPTAAGKSYWDEGQ